LARGFLWKCYLICDFNDFDFLDLEKPRTWEKHPIVQLRLVDVNLVNTNGTIGVCIAAVGNIFSLNISNSM
jgi:hypothetical protein